MCRRLLQLNALRAFEVAARHRSLSRAAEELAVTPAAVHHQVKSLEENLGVNLFIRSGNNLELTQAATAILPTLEGAFDLLSLATERLKQHAESRPLSVAACPALAQKWLIPRMGRFKADFPHVELRLSTVEQLPDLATTEVDLAVVYSPSDSFEQASTVTELLLKDEAYPVCSPEFQARHMLHREEDLSTSQILHDNQLLHSRGIGWAQWLEGRAAGQWDEGLQGNVLRMDSTILAIEAAISGNGVVLAPHSLVQQDISAGRLVRLFSRSVQIPGGYYLAHLDSLPVQPMATAFQEWIFAEVSVNRELLGRTVKASVPIRAVPSGRDPKKDRKKASPRATPDTPYRFPATAI